MPFNALLGQRRHSRRDLAIDRNIGNPDFHGWSNQRSRLARMPIQEALALQRGEVLHHRCLASKPEMILDFARAGRDPFLALLSLDKIEHVFLTIREHYSMLAYY